MSASREKSKRKETPVSNAASKVTKAPKGMSKGLKTFLTVVVIVLVVAVVAFFSMMQNGFFASHSTAAVVSGHKVSPAMMNYFYRDAISQMSSYASYFGLDTTKPMTEQVFNEETGETWADYFMDQAALAAANTYAMYDEAVANGFQLDEANQANVNASVDMAKVYAKYNGMTSGDAFIAANYGTGCNMKNYKEYVTVSTVAGQYASQVNSDFTYTAEQVAAEYEANKNDYDGVNYRLFTITDSFFASEDDAEDADYTDQKAALANEMAAAVGTSEEEFIAQAKANAPEDSADLYADDDYTLHTDVEYASCSSDLADWLFDEARTENECAVLNGESNYYVVMYLGRDTHDYQLPGVDHILISVEDTTDTAAMASAFAKAGEILAEYKSGEQTYEAFKALGDKYVTEGAAAEANLYENIEPGTMVANFNDWAFDPARQVGDTEILESEYGYHVMYFYGYGDTFRDHQAEGALRDADYSAWQTSVTENAEYELVPFGVRFITK